MGGGWEISVSGGPSFFSVDQDLVEDITIDQTYPYDTATFASAVSTRHSTSGLGFNVGADVAYFFSRHIGVGGVVRFNQGTVEIDKEPLTEQPAEWKAGHTIIGGGLRLRFLFDVMPET